MPKPIQKDSPVSELRSHTGYWLRLVSNQVSKAFAAQLDEMGSSVAEWVVLREIYAAGGSVAPSVVADLGGLTRGAVTKVIDRLLAKRLVTRRESISDRRYQDLCLTAEGKAVVPQLAAAADRNDAAFFAALSPSERMALLGLMKKLAKVHAMTNIPVD